MVYNADFLLRGIMLVCVAWYNADFVARYYADFVR